MSMFKMFGNLKSVKYYESSVCSVSVFKRKGDERQGLRREVQVDKVGVRRNKRGKWLYSN